MCRGQIAVLGAVKIAATTREIAACGFVRKWASGELCACCSWGGKEDLYGQPAVTTYKKSARVYYTGGPWLMKILLSFNPLTPFEG